MKPKQGQSNGTDNIRALILAAGRSTRMDGFKPLLPLGGVSVLERQIAQFRRAGIERPVVVCGFRGGETARIAAGAGAESVLNERFDEGMFSSVQAGAAALGSDCRAFFVLPVDVMLVRPDTIRRLLAAHTVAPDALIHPVFAGQRGHPPLIPGDLIGAILEYGGAGGLAGVLAGREDRAVDVPVADAGVLFDVDTDADYGQALERLARLDRLDRSECEAMFEIMDVQETRRAHSRLVAEIALKMARALNRVRGREPGLDLGLIESAGLLHDIVRNLPRHELEGGRLLDEMGYPRVAEIVAAHRDLDLGGHEPIGERELVYLADKMAKGDRLVEIHERFQIWLDRLAHDPEAVSAIKGRRGRALKVKARVEAELGTTLENLILSEK